MVYSDPANFGETSTRLQKLCERISKLRDSLGLPVEDARHIALVACSDISQCVGVSAHIVKSFECGILKAEDLDRIAGIIPDQAKDAIALWIKNNRNSFLVMYQFTIENLLRNLSKEIGIETRKKGFAEISRALLGKLDLLEFLDLLSLPALIRNTLHNNGIHSGQHDKVTIDDFEFEFRNNEAVVCSGWGHIILAVNGSLDVVEKLLKHDRIARLNTPIEDLGAWDIFTRPATS